MENSAKAADKSSRKKNLEQKSEQELKELLKMQENLLQNKRLIKSLPDKGKRISEFVDEIQEALKAVNNIDRTVDRLNRMQLGDHHLGLSDKIEDAVLQDLQQFVNNPTKEKIVIDERRNYPNSYEFIMKKNNTVAKSSSKNLKLNRLPVKDEIDSEMAVVENSSLTKCALPSKSEVTTFPSHLAKEITGKESSRRLKHVYDASLEEEMYSYKGRGSRGIKIIGIEESMELLNRHHQAAKEAELKRAEAMLMANSETKLSTDNIQWHGDKFNKYRDEQEVTVEDHDKYDDEDDESDCDYGDADDSQED